MKAVILAGGLGTRLSEETVVKPKPMVEIGGHPILWHIMKLYSSHGINEFIICLGYKGYVIKEYFANYFLHMSDVTFNIAKNSMTVHQNNAEPWSVTLVNTGDNTMTGGRIKRIGPYIKEDLFLCTYGDGLSDVNIKELIAFHKSHGKVATLTVTQPPGRFGAVEIEEGAVKMFREKPDGDGGWINGGFFVFSPKVFDLIDSDEDVLEKKVLEKLARQNELMAFTHRGFWNPMDTLRDKNYLENLWVTGSPPWKTW